MNSLSGIACFAVLAGSLVTGSICHGENPLQDQGPLQDQSPLMQAVAPILQRHCLRCHNDQQREGDLSLQNRQALLDSGHVVLGDAAASRLLEVISPADGQAEMPQNSPALSSTEIKTIARWIDQGAVWPDDLQLHPVAIASFDWWSYRPIAAPPVPAIDDRWVQTPIDAFVLEQLRQRNLQPSAPADRRTLIRRLSYDLHGLPPSPEAVAAFVADRDPRAYEKLVDQLLASPHYGERWAQHWLDVVQYADTCGYDKDKLRPNAWPYRDYVVRSFNQDKPYRRFVQEQLAGDVLWADHPDGIIGLGFIAAGPWDFIGHVEVPESKIDGMVARHLDRDNMVANTLNTFCSVTVQCARCHDHKFDPITQQHYYGLQAIFAAVDRADRPYDVDPSTGEQRQVYAAATDFPVQGQFKPTGGQPRTVHLLHRGNVDQPRHPVSPGLLPLTAEANVELDPQSTEAQRRAALATWLTDDEHPLVWRSIANRIWQYHFGDGLVSTPNDFGRMGSQPTHPALLDWLADQLRQGQSIKRLHRLILTSSVYQQSADWNADHAAIDGGNQWWWRMNRRRLEAEEIRDSILAASDALDRRMGGPGFYLFELEKSEHSPHYQYHKFDPADPQTHRRSIYRFVVRSQPDPWMTALDCADSSQSTPRRSETLTSLQALSLMNNRFSLVMAQQFAARLQRETADLDQQVDLAMQCIVQRPPEEIERDQMVAYAGKHGLTNLCRWLFNLSEFVYVD